MTTPNQDVEVYAGDSHTLTITIANQEDNLKPLKLAGAELTWTLYQEPYHMTKFEKTTELGGITIVDASEGMVKVNLLATDTEPLKVGITYTHHLRVRNNIGQQSTVLTGKLTIKN